MTNGKMATHNKLRTFLIGFILALTAFAGGLYSFQLLSYDFKTLDETKYKHTDLEGSVVVINYFAQWCAPCLREIPELNEFYHQAPQRVKLFAVSFDELTPTELAGIKAKYDIEFPLISEITTQFPFEKPQYLPATFIIKPSGELAGQLLGEQTVESLNEATSAF
jgi:thiol-disulfide isomerase/thioredoxin